MNEGRTVAQGTPDEIAAGLKSNDSFDLTVSGVSAEDLQCKINRVSGYAFASSITGLGSGMVSCRISLESSKDQRPGGECIFDWAIQEGLKMLELTRIKASLEDIFVKLTREGGIKRRIRLCWSERNSAVLWIILFMGNHTFHQSSHACRGG